MLQMTLNHEIGIKPIIPTYEYSNVNNSLMGPIAKHIRKITPLRVVKMAKNGVSQRSGVTFFNVTFGRDVF